MAAIIKATIQGYQRLREFSDPRVQDWFLMSSPWPMVAILASYLYFVLSLGPKMMKNKAPFKLDGVIKAFDVVQILLCGWIFQDACRALIQSGYSLVGEPIDYSNRPEAIQICGLHWSYCMVKFLDLLDTVFFVLKKNDRQITFLHVYHHTGMCVMTWLSTKFMGGGHGTYLGVVNLLVHVIMYSYYLLAANNPEFKKKIWLKKCITQIQMAQFLFLMVQNTALVLMEEPRFPRWAGGILSIQSTFMLTLFYDFYRKAYYPAKTSLKSS